MAANNPFADVAVAKKCLSEVLSAILPLVKDGGDLAKLITSPECPKVGDDGDEAPRKQFLMGKALPLVSPALTGVYQKYGFPPGPMGVMAASMQLGAVQDADVAAGLAVVKGAAMSGIIPTEAALNELIAKLGA